MSLLTFFYYTKLNYDDTIMKSYFSSLPHCCCQRLYIKVHVCMCVCVWALTDQVDCSLVEGRGLQDLLHGDCLQFVRVQVFTLVRNAVVHDYRQRTHTRLLIVCPSFLEKKRLM